MTALQILLLIALAVGSVLIVLMVSVIMIWSLTSIVISMVEKNPPNMNNTHEGDNR